MPDDTVEQIRQLRRLANWVRTLGHEDDLSSVGNVIDDYADHLAQSVTRRIFVDLDGVLADFDAEHQVVFGYLPRRDEPDPPGFWDTLGAWKDGHFYADLPLMPDARDLWDGVTRRAGLEPIILTGLPYSMPHAEADKRAWVRKHFGDALVIACLSKDKRRWARPGDILIDDWNRYRHLWDDMGGTFILHTSAVNSLAQLDALFPSPEAQP